MKKLIYYSIISFMLSAIAVSCGSSKNAALKSAEQKRIDDKQKMDKMDQDKKKFELQNNNNLK